MINIKIKNKNISTSLSIALLAISFSAFSNKIASSAIVSGTAVYDAAVDSTLTEIDKKLQSQVEFLQEIEASGLETNTNLSGNKRIGYAINSAPNLFEDYFSLTLGERKKTNSIKIVKNLDSIFPLQTKTNPSGNYLRLNKEKYQQRALKSSMILSDMTINAAREKGAEITSLAGTIDTSNTLKESIDVNNRLLLELVLAQRNANLLMANFIKSQNAQIYRGEIEIDKSEDGKGELGQDEISKKLKRNRKNSKFYQKTR